MLSGLVAGRLGAQLQVHLVSVSSTMKAEDRSQHVRQHHTRHEVGKLTWTAKKAVRLLSWKDPSCREYSGLSG